MNKLKVTNENTDTLKSNEIFVFGSNLAGIHGGGAAKLAKDKFGAAIGVGEGITGQCYALPTKDKDIQTLPIVDIWKSVEVLREYVKNNNDKFFIITAVGCGLAGYSATDIAPMFESFKDLDNVSLPQSFIDVIFPKVFIGFKVTDKNMKCRDFQFTMNKEHSIEGKVEICSNGFHFCKELKDCFNYYTFSPENRVFVVEGSGDFDFNGDKVAYQNIKFIKELNWFDVLSTVNTGVGNSGLSNSGNRNSGNRNSGDYNSGNRNSGDYNSGNHNSGYFNNTDSKVKLFGVQTELSHSEVNMPYIKLPINVWVIESNMTDDEKRKYPKFYVTQGYLKTLSYKESWKNAWSKVDEDLKNRFKNLPHFNAEIFEDITGIKI